MRENPDRRPSSVIWRSERPQPLCGVEGILLIMSTHTVQIVTGHAPDGLVRFAAEELASYLERLFQVESTVTAAAGPAEATVFLDAAAGGIEPPEPDEAFRLRYGTHAGHPALTAAGGSPRATLWAVYDLVQRWGVRFLLRGDVLPAAPGEFHLPQVDVVCQPNLAFRGARLINLFSMGLESWSAAQICGYLDQLAKLKFNAVYHQLWCWQPYVHYECRGMAKRTGNHWFGWNYRIGDQTIGRHHFGGDGPFVPPDFVHCRNYDQRVTVGTDLVRRSLVHARKRGIRTQIATVLTDFPVEFCHVLGMPPLAPHGMGLAVSGGHKGADDPAFQDMCATALRAYVDTYPQADSYGILMPEFHAPEVPYERAWQRLDAKYGLHRVRTLEQVLEQAGSRSDFAGGADRVVRNVKGDIVALDLFDRLLDEQKILDDSAKPDAAIELLQVAEELAEVYGLIRPGIQAPCVLDYTSSRMAKRPDAFDRIGKSGVRPVVIMTTQDDNIGVIPQLATASIHQMLGLLRQYGWEGFQLRYWMISEMEPTVAYLSAATWDESVDPQTAYRDHACAVCGPQAVSDLVACFKILDQITIGLGDYGLGIGFPIPAMGIRHWEAGSRLSDALRADRTSYQRALALARSALQQATRGHDYLAYMIGRLEFGIGYLEMVDTLGQAGQANQQGQRAEAIRLLKRGCELARQSVTIFARIAQPTDRGTLAQLNEDLVTKLPRLLEAVEAGKPWTLPRAVAGERPYAPL